MFAHLATAFMAFLRPARYSEYIPLETSNQEDARDSPAQSPPRASSGNTTLVLWACIGVLCSTVLSFALVAKSIVYSQPTDLVLRRPSQYVNLDKVLRNVSYPVSSIMNFPPVVLQVESSSNLRSISEDERGWYSYQGSVYPDDRHIKVSPKVSTVVQFRNLDFRMERCVLHISIPQRTDEFDPMARILSPSTIDVWVLDTTLEITPRNPKTWVRAPDRRSHFTTLSIIEGGNSTSPEFFCPSGEFTSFELACPSTTNPASCDVDFWQDQRAIPRAGVYLVQSLAL